MASYLSSEKPVAGVWVGEQEMLALKVPIVASEGDVYVARLLPLI